MAPSYICYMDNCFCNELNTIVHHRLEYEYSTSRRFIIDIGIHALVLVDEVVIYRIL